MSLGRPPPENQYHPGLSDGMNKSNMGPLPPPPHNMGPPGTSYNGIPPPSQSLPGGYKPNPSVPSNLNGSSGMVAMAPPPQAGGGMLGHHPGPSSSAPGEVGNYMSGLPPPLNGSSGMMPRMASPNANGVSSPMMPPGPSSLNMASPRMPLGSPAMPPLSGIEGAPSAVPSPVSNSGNPSFKMPPGGGAGSAHRMPLVPGAPGLSPRMPFPMSSSGEPSLTMPSPMSSGAFSGGTSPMPSIASSRMPPPIMNISSPQMTPSNSDVMTEGMSSLSLSSQAPSGMHPLISDASKPQMPPTMSSVASGMPPTMSNVSSPGVPPPMANISSPGMPPPMVNVSSSGMPHQMANVSSSGMPPQMANVSSSGMPPSMSNISSPGMPPTMSNTSSEMPSMPSAASPAMPPTMSSLASPRMHLVSGVASPGVPSPISSVPSPGMPPPMSSGASSGMPPPMLNNSGSLPSMPISSGGSMSGRLPSTSNISGMPTDTSSVSVSSYANKLHSGGPPMVNPNEPSEMVTPGSSCGRPGVPPPLSNTTNISSGVPSPLSNLSGPPPPVTSNFGASLNVHPSTLAPGGMHPHTPMNSEPSFGGFTPETSSRMMHPMSVSGAPPTTPHGFPSQASASNMGTTPLQPSFNSGLPPTPNPGGFPPPRTPHGITQSPFNGVPNSSSSPMMPPPIRPGVMSSPGGPMLQRPLRPGMPPSMGGPPGPNISGPPMGGGMPPRPGGYQPGVAPSSMPTPGGMPPTMVNNFQQGQHRHGYPPNPYGGDQSNQYASAPQSGKRTLDPDHMPSPITVMEDDSKSNSGYFDTREKGQVPPLVTTKFVVRDFGNSSPRYIRSTIYHVLATPDLLKQCGVPFSLVISPLAKIEAGENEPAITDFGPTGPVRCSRCKAYMCSFMQFVDGGRRFQCVFCKATTEVPQEYFQHLDHNGLRLDHYQRPELCMGTYEALATKEYCRNSVDPQPPGIIFAIDVSYPMIKEGVVNLVCQNMKELLKKLPVDFNCDRSKMKVGFMTYDNKIHFYNISGMLVQPQQLTVGDVHDMFVPLVDGFMVNVEEAEAVIDALMEQIPVMFGETRETETVLGPVIQAGKEAFKAAKCAGKLIVFHHNLPVCEAPGKLKNRDDRKLLNTDKEKTVLSPQSKFYNELGQDCVSAGCSVDLFLFNNAYIDIATLSQVCRLTGGQIYKYTYFQPEIDGERFLSDLEHNISRPVVFDAIMRVRTSTGVRPVDFFGSFYMANSTDTEVASMNSDMSVACEIKHDDKLTDEDGVYIQVALLFTSCSGQRRLRIINLSLNTGSNLADMYRSCDLDTMINFTAKQSISRLMESNPKAVKEALINNCAQILACYRKNCTSMSSAGQLILPECMKLLPLYTNCLIKSDSLAGGQDVGCDERAFLMSVVSSMDVKSSVSFFYPSLISIYDVDPEETHIPGIIRCSAEKLREEGAYLLDNGLYLFMYIGLAVDSSWVRDVFGVTSASQIDVEKVRFEREYRDNPTYKRVFGIIRDIRKRHPRHMRLVIVRPRDKLDVLFKHYLCEDRTGNEGNFSYVDFLCYMHKEIRALLG